MLVDSFRFLPRSFAVMWESVEPAPGEGEPVWAPFEKRLSESRIAMLTSAGLYLDGEQEPFDGEREKAEPTWGDPTWRAIPQDLNGHKIGMMHLHVNNTDVLADHNIALPTDLLAELAADGVVAGASGPGTRVDIDLEWPQPRGEAYKAWQPAEPSPIVAMMLNRN